MNTSKTTISMSGNGASEYLRRFVVYKIGVSFKVFFLISFFSAEKTLTPDFFLKRLSGKSEIKALLTKVIKACEVNEIKCLSKQQNYNSTS